MYRIIKYPYEELTQHELDGIEEFKIKHNVTDKDIYVYYITDWSLGVGYDIVVSLWHPYKINDTLKFKEEFYNITDIENECEML